VPWPTESTPLYGDSEGETDMATHEQAVAHKQTRARAATSKVWNFTVVSDGQAAADFLNLDPAQGAGEAFASDLDDGQIGVWYFL
jgi:hypothetical protein